MPEGPEVRRVAEWLRSQMIGTTIISFGWSDRSRYHDRKRQRAQPEWYDNCYSFYCHLPTEVVNVWSHGKHILFEVRNSATGATIYINNHLNMTGNWSYTQSEYGNFWFNLETATDQRAIFFDDARTLGYVNFYNNKEAFERDLHGKVGPDLLQAALDGNSLRDQWVNQMTLNNRRKNILLHKFLHEQKYFSGIGNYLRAEIMYEAGINPFRTLGSLTEEEIVLLYEKAITIIHDSYLSHGLTISSYQDPAGYPGTYDVKVYRQTHDPYGNPVEQHKASGGQTIHWVPQIQK